MAALNNSSFDQWRLSDRWRLTSGGFDQWGSTIAVLTIDDFDQWWI